MNSLKPDVINLCHLIMIKTPPFLEYTNKRKGRTMILARTNNYVSNFMQMTFVFASRAGLGM